MKKLSIILVCFFSLIIIIYTVHFYHQLYQCKFHTEQSLKMALFVELMRHHSETGELKLPYYKMDSIMKEYPGIEQIEYDFILDSLNIKWYENEND